MKIKYRYKILSILISTLMIGSIFIGNVNANYDEGESIEKCATSTRVTVMESDNETDDKSSGSSFVCFEDDREWNVLVDHDEWGNIGKVNQQIFLYKLKYDESNEYDWYSIRWQIQSVPGIILWDNNNWRTDKITNWANCDKHDSYVRLIDYDPWGDHGVTTIGVNIGVAAGESGAEVTAGLSWSYSQEDFMQFDYSDFSDELVNWMHDDMHDDLMQTITVEPGFVIKLPQSNDWTIHFRTKVKFHNPDPYFPFDPFDWFFIQNLTWEWNNWNHNFEPDVPLRPSGPLSGKKGLTYSFDTRTVDPDGDNVQYKFDWGDGTSTITGWFNSDALAEESHAWNNAGTYSIKVKAKDENGYWSEWSSVHYITIEDDDPPPPPPLCFMPGTPINMADGSYKNIEDVEIGDWVKVFNEKTKDITTASVNVIDAVWHDNVHELYLDNGKILLPTANHPFFTKDKGWATIDGFDGKKLEIGDYLYCLNHRDDLKEVKVIDIVPVDGNYLTYNFIDMKYGTFIADDIVVHNSFGISTLDEISIVQSDIILSQIFGFFNQNPIANIDVFSYRVTTITFDGSSSYDPDGTIVTYEWDFGDNSTSSEVSPTYIYDISGKYTVMLTVTDNYGAKDIDEKVIYC